MCYFYNFAVRSLLNICFFFFSHFWFVFFFLRWIRRLNWIHATLNQNQANWLGYSMLTKGLIIINERCLSVFWLHHSKFDSHTLLRFLGHCDYATMTIIIEHNQPSRYFFSHSSLIFAAGFFFIVNINWT